MEKVKQTIIVKEELQILDYGNSSATAFCDLIDEVDMPDIEREFETDNVRIWLNDSIPKGLERKLQKVSDDDRISCKESFEEMGQFDCTNMNSSDYKIELSEDTTDGEIQDSWIFNEETSPAVSPDLSQDDNSIGEYENLPLSSVMTDHNYTSQEFDDKINMETDKLKKLIEKRMISNVCSRYANDPAIISNISNFVEHIMENISKFKLDNFGIKEREGSVSYSGNEADSEMFVQSVMDKVVADDSEDIPAILTDCHSKTKSPTYVKPFEETGTNSNGNTSHERDSKSITDSVVTNINLTIPESEQNSKDIEIKNDQVTTKDTSQSDENSKLFSSVIEDSDNKNSPSSKLWVDVTLFAKEFKDGCEALLIESDDSEEKLKEFVMKQYNYLNSLVRCNNLLSDSGIQTDKELSIRKLKKLNSIDRENLLASSGSETSSLRSDNSSVSSLSCTTSCSSSMEDITSLTNTDNLLDYNNDCKVSKENQSSSVDDENGLMTNESLGDGKDSERQEIQTNGHGESDKENSCSSTKNNNKRKANDDYDEEDREIERLLNLNTLNKRQTATSSTKTNENDKSKSKPQAQKSTDKILDFLQEENFNIESDGSICQSDQEEEFITEKQYLARYNENLKEQFLNNSSSESELSDNLQDVLNLSDDDDEDGKKSPLVDKFLKTFSLEESEDDDDDEHEDDNDDETANKDSNNEKSDFDNLDYKNDLSGSPTVTENHQLDEKKCSDNQENDTKDAYKCDKSPNDSDCELLNNNLIFKKRQQKSKSLDKMLYDADKRKKISKIEEDLISLSSENDSSDVEAVDLEENQTKSRIIKPMLRQDQLAGETRLAQKRETERIRRLEKKQHMVTKIIEEKCPNYKEAENNELILDYYEATKTFIKVHPDIVKHLKPHQVDGVKFMYDSCYGSVDSLRKRDGSGCILAHCMGLGKTLQLIALLHTVISYKELKTKKVLVLCPKSTVMNWADEIIRWLGPLNAKNLKVYTFNDTSDIDEKLEVLREWSLATYQKAGCLLLGYEAYRTVVFYHKYKNRCNKPSLRLDKIKEKVNEYLLDPGADLVVCDEGHIIKNSKSAISLAVAELKTPKRIVLTGTPIQNNLKEYYSMVNFIKPLFLGTEKEFANLYANPIKNGQHKDSSKKEIKVMQQRSFVLHKKLSKFVQRKEAELLKSFLPQKFEYVLFIPMTTVQNNLYEFILKDISKREENRGRGLITDYTCLRKIWTHPKVLENAWKNATLLKTKKDARRNAALNSDEDQPDDIYDSQTGVMSVTNDWWRTLLTDQDLETIMPSNKLRTMFEILRMCEEKDEKCLIFSAFVAVLNVVEFFFTKINNRDSTTLADLNITPNNKLRNTWVSGYDYYRLDGKTPKSIRHEMIKTFNSVENKRARVFLISAKAGGQGINLTGANRVIILDTSWNPSNDQQNIFRVFRLGQKKNCYIYRLLAMGTMEEKVYSRSVTKQAMSFRVVDEQQIDRHYSMAELAELYTLTTPDYSSRPMPVFPQDIILASLLLNYPELVYKYHEHDSLLENKVEQELSEQEKSDAWAAYERDMQMSTEMPNMSNLDNLMQMNFPGTKMPNYFNSLGGLDSFMNYSSFGQQTSAASSYFLPPYNYPHSQASAQQIMDLMSMYSKFSNPSAYIDLSKPDGGPGSNSGYNLPSYGSSASKSLPTNPSLLPSLAHGAGNSGLLNSNPLSALGDLSLFGISGATGNPTPHGLSSPSLYGSSLPPNRNMPSSSMSMLPNLDQYGGLESSFHYLMGKKDYPPPSLSSAAANLKMPNLTNSSNLLPNPLSSAFLGAISNPPTPLLDQSYRGTGTMDKTGYSSNVGRPGEVTTLSKSMEKKKAPKKGPFTSNGVDAYAVNTPNPTGHPPQTFGNPRALPSISNSFSYAPTLSKPTMDSTRKNTESSSSGSLTPTFTPINLPYRSSIMSTTSVASSTTTTPVTAVPANTTNKSSATTVSSANNSGNITKTLPDRLRNEIQIVAATTTANKFNLPKQFNEPPNISLTAIQTVTTTAAKSVPPATITNSKLKVSSNTSSSNFSSGASKTTGRPNSISISTTASLAPISSPTVQNKLQNSSNVASVGNKEKPHSHQHIKPQQKPPPLSMPSTTARTSSPSTMKGANKFVSLKQPTKSLMLPTKHPVGQDSSSISSKKPPALSITAATSTKTIPTSSLKVSSSVITRKPQMVSTSIKSTPTLTTSKPKGQPHAPYPILNNYLNVSTTKPQQKIPTSGVASTSQLAHMKLLKKPSVKPNTITMGAQSKVPSLTGSTVSRPQTPQSQMKLQKPQAQQLKQQSQIQQQNMQQRSLNKLPQHVKLVRSINSSPTTTNSGKPISPTNAANSNALNIREVNRNPTGTGVYIIETNINEKKIAIGTPTKNGGGTTITKIPLQRKRKSEDDTHPDNRSEVKRQKNSNNISK